MSAPTCFHCERPGTRAPLVGVDLEGRPTATRAAAHYHAACLRRRTVHVDPRKRIHIAAPTGAPKKRNR